jgi:hypothetical protein
MKILLNEFLQNAAFPAVVLAFACAPINNKIPDLQASRFPEHHGIRMVKSPVAPIFALRGDLPFGDPRSEISRNREVPGWRRDRQW